MNRLMSLFRKGNGNNMQRQPFQTGMNMKWGTGAAMSLIALGVGVTAYGIARRRNGRNMFRKLLQPLR